MLEITIQLKVQYNSSLCLVLRCLLVTVVDMEVVPLYSVGNKSWQTNNALLTNEIFVLNLFRSIRRIHK